VKFPNGLDMKHRIDMKSIVTLVTILILVGCEATTRTYMGRRVVDVPFPIASGKIVTLPTTDGGAIPAENVDYKIEFAGFFIGPSGSDAKRANLTWRFALTDKTSKSIERIFIDEVSPSEIEKLILQDNAPKLNNGVWTGATEPIEASHTSTPWLYMDKASIYVFRFTLHSRGEPPTVLYQLTWFSKPTKEAFRQKIDLINGS
jgi:hypothetical protein